MHVTNSLSLSLSLSLCPVQIWSSPSSDMISQNLMLLPLVDRKPGELPCSSWKITLTIILSWSDPHFKYTDIPLPLLIFYCWNSKTGPDTRYLRHPVVLCRTTRWKGQNCQSSSKSVIFSNLHSLRICKKAWNKSWTHNQTTNRRGNKNQPHFVL